LDLLEPVHEVENDRGADEINAEIASQAKHPPQPRYGSDPEHRRVSRNGFNDTEPYQVCDPFRTNPRRSRKFLNGEQHFGFRWHLTLPHA